jgi:hypothetical protein
MMHSKDVYRAVVWTMAYFAWQPLASQMAAWLSGTQVIDPGLEFFAALVERETHSTDSSQQMQMQAGIEKVDLDVARDPDSFWTAGYQRNGLQKVVPQFMTLPPRLPSQLLLAGKALILLRQFSPRHPLFETRMRGGGIHRLTHLLDMAFTPEAARQADATLREDLRSVIRGWVDWEKQHVEERRRRRAVVEKRRQARHEAVNTLCSPHFYPQLFSSNGLKLHYKQMERYQAMKELEKVKAQEVAMAKKRAWASNVEVSFCISYSWLKTVSPC